MKMKMKMEDIQSWTGGSHPKKMLQCTQDEQILRSFLFKEQMADVKKYWGDYRGMCKTVLDMARVQYLRARYDAHATYRKDDE